MDDGQRPESYTSYPTRQSKKRKTLTFAEKHRIYQFHHENPLVTHGSIAEFFGVERSTVSKIVRQPYDPLPVASESPHPIRNSQPTALNPDSTMRVETQLLDWARGARMRGITITRDMMRAQAAVFANPTLASFLQPSSSTEIPQTPATTPLIDMQSTNTLQLFQEQLPKAVTHLSDLELDLLSRTSSSATIHNNEKSHLGSNSTATGTLSSNSQHDFLYNVLNHTETSDQMSSFDTATSSTELGNKTILHRPTYSDPLEKMLDSVYSQDARSAFETVESYIVNLPSMTALDQLCLGHLKTCLDRS